MSETNETQARVYGIDLGTTYCCISYLDDTGRPVVCQSMEGENTTPSVVRLLPEEEEPVVGRTAKDMAVLYPDNTIQFVKSKIGKVESFEYGPEDNRLTTTPVDVSAEILKKLAKDAEAITNSPVKDVVITVPAYFGQAEKLQTKEAGIRAGLNVVNIVEEPTAAAFYYGCQHDEDEVICIFDLGGGTFDVTAMELKDGNLTVITTDGNHDLGGKNWDAELLAMVEEKFREQTGFDEEFESDTLQDLMIKCENAKKQLSSANSVNIAINVDRNHRASIQVTREEFDSRTSFLLSTAIDLTQTVIDRVEEKGMKVDKILLVGGSTKMPQVGEAIKEEFGMEALINEPDESVSKGACIYCAWDIWKQIKDSGNDAESPDGAPGTGDGDSESPSGGSGGMKIGGDTVTDVSTNSEGETTVTIRDEEGVRTIPISLPPAVQKKKIVTVATKSLGIRTLNEQGKPVITNLIFKDTKLPAEFSNTFGTAEADMVNIGINLYQSEFYEEHYEVEDGVLIGESILEGLPSGLPAGAPVDITIKMAENGLVEITGAHQGTPLIGKLELNYSEGTVTA